MSDLIYMKHPDLPAAEPARVTKDAFDKVYKGKGWQALTEKQASEQSAAYAKSLTPQKAEKPSEKAGGAA